jgi:hypothetical protein
VKRVRVIAETMVKRGYWPIYVLLRRED